MPVIYIDVLFLLNLWVDFLLLSATARLRRIPYRRRRLLFGSVVGAAGSLVLFLPPLSWWAALLIRLGGSALLIRITFRFAGWRTWSADLLTFLTLSAAFSGAATMLWYFVAPRGFLTVNGVIYYDAPASLLIVFTGMAYIAICLFEYTMRRRAPQNRTYRLVIHHRGKTVVCRCLYDTGSTLREPFSGKPAVLIDRAAAAPLLSSDEMSEGKNMPRFVPYKSLGGEGLLPAFLPYRMEIADDTKAQDITGSYLAVCEQLGHGEYTALVGTDIGDLLERGDAVCKH